MRYGDTNKKTPIYVIIQLCHIGTEKKELIEVNMRHDKNESINRFDYHTFCVNLHTQFFTV